MLKCNRKIIVVILSLALLVLPITSSVHAQTADAFEPDNSFAQYSSMTVTSSLQSQSRSIMPAGDNDYIRFLASPGQYTFYTSSSIDTYGYLYDANHTQLTSDDNSGGNLQFKIVYNISSAGYYFLRVTGYNDNITGDYALYYFCELGSLELSPSSGPGGVSVDFTGSGYPASTSVTISYYDPTFDSWNYFQSATANSTGDITFSTEMPDLRQSVGSGDNSEAYTAISFRADVNGTVYCDADYNEYLRGLKTVGTQTAYGLYGNGTDLSSSVSVEPGDTIALSGEWFHSSSVIYVRWDSASVVGTVTSDEWNNAVIIGTTIASPTGSFETAVTIPATDTGQHYISIEDSQTRVITRILVCPTSDWNYTYGTKNLEILFSTIKTSDGGYASIGYTNSSGTSDVLLVKTDCIGNMLWNKTYGGTGIDMGYSIIQDNDGGFVIAGSTTSFGAGSYDVYLVKTDSYGNLEWYHTYGGTGSDMGYSIVRAYDGGFAIAGSTTPFGSGSSDVYLVKTDPYGNFQWYQTYGGIGTDVGYSIIQDNDGGFAIAGFTTSFGAGSYDVYLVKTDSYGNLEWYNTYGGTGSDMGYSIVQTDSGGYAIAGSTTSFGAGGADAYIVNTDSSGNMQWNKTYGLTGTDIGYSIIENNMREFIVAGVTTPFNQTVPDAFLLKINGNGNITASKTFGGTGADAGRCVIQSIDESYVLGAYTNSFGAGNYDFWLIKTSAINTQPVHNINTGLSYTSIQKAIDAGATRNGDTIYVDNGVYTENVVIDKSIKLRSQNNASTTIDGAYIGNVISVIANNVEVSGFTIQNSGYSPGYGIYVGSVTGANISSNIINNNYYGIGVSSSSNCEIIGNQLTDNYWLDVNIENSSQIALTNDNITHQYYVGGLQVYNSNVDLISCNNPYSYTVVYGNSRMTALNSSLASLEIRDNASLLLQNSSTNYIYAYDTSNITILDSNTESGTIYVENQSSLLLQDSNVNYIEAYGNSNVTVLNSTISWFYIEQQASLLLLNTNVTGYVEAYGNSNVTVLNSTLWDIYASDSSSVNISGSTVSYADISDAASLVLHDTNVTGSLGISVSNSILNITGLPGVYASYFNVSDYISVTAGSYPHLIATNSNIAYLSFILYNSTVNLSNCNVTAYIEAYGNSNVTVLDSTISWFYIEQQASVSVYDSSIGGIYTWNLNNTLLLSNVTVDSFSVDESNFYLQGNFTASGYGYSYWYNSNVTRDFSVVVKDLAGNVVPNAELKLYDQAKTVVWSGYSDPNGKANFTVTFTDVNYAGGLTLKAVKQDLASLTSISFLSNSTVVLSIHPPTVHNVDTGFSYYTIQEAIDANKTANGQTIFVENGTYYENVVVNKSIKLIGENNASTIIDGGNNQNAIYVTADNVEITGFTIQNSGGSYSSSMPNCGILVESSTGANISYNILKNNYYYAIVAENSSLVNVSHNLITNNQGGIILFNSSESIVSQNTLVQNELGIGTLNCSAINISQNDITGTPNYLYGYGIVLELSLNVTTSGNSVMQNEYGLFLYYCQNSSIYENYIINNTCGITLWNSQYNLIYHNFFIANVNQTATLESNFNVWDNGYPSGGNYWSDYAGTDSNHDGIGDTPYVIDAYNIDNYPLMSPWTPPPQFNISASAGANGQISPSGNVSVNFGGSQSFNITANAGYHIVDVVVDSVSQGAVSSYTFTNVTAAHSLTATFAINTYSITVTQGANGQIAPGTTTVNYGATPSFTITPNAGYHIASITANGASVTVTSPSGQSYQFSAVSADGSLTATFAINTYTITVTQANHGTITPGTTVVNYGGSQSFSITPDTGYHIVDVVVDGASKGAVTSYTISNVQATHMITASFAINTYAITVTQGANGLIAPGTTTVNYGGSQTFTITANTGYYIADVSVNGGSVGAVSSYTFTNVQAAYTITATFAQTSTSTSTSTATSTPTPTSSPSPTPTPPPTPTVTYNTTTTISTTGVEHITETNNTGISIDINGNPGTNVTVTINVYNSNPQPSATLPEGVTLTHYVTVAFNMDPNNFTQATVTIHYLPSDVQGLTSPYGIYKYIPENNSYVELFASNDLASQTLTVTLNSPNDPLFAIGNSYTGYTSPTPTQTTTSTGGTPLFIYLVAIVIAFAVTGTAIALIMKKRNTH